MQAVEKFFSYYGILFTTEEKKVLQSNLRRSYYVELRIIVKEVTDHAEILIHILKSFSLK